MRLEEKTEAKSAAQAQISASKAYGQLTKLFDEGVFTELDAFVKSKDGYAEVITAHGSVEGIGVYAFAQNIDAAGGAMSVAQASKLKRLYDLALKTGEPVIGMYDSVGGRLEEGADMLASYGDILKYTNNLSGVVPQISVILGKCYGTQALIAVGADFVVMSEKASFSLETDGSGADPEENAKKGIAHILAKDEDEAIAQTKMLVSILPSNNLSAACIAYDSISEQAAVESGMTAREAAFAVADCDSLIELQKEHGKAASTALATFNGTTAGIVVLEGKELDGKSCAKAARFIRFCDAFSIPVVSFVNAQKFACLRGAAKLTAAYAEATTAKVTMITGEAYGAVYIAAAGTGAAADLTYAWTGATVSALNPEAAAVIALGDDLGGKLKGSKNPVEDRAAVITAFKESELTAMKAAEKGYIDALTDAEETRTVLVSALDMLCNKRVSTLPKKHNNLFV